MKREDILRRDLGKLNDAQGKLAGLEAKARNIEAKHGYVPRQVADELAKAEMDYSYWLYMYKDDRHDPFLAD